MSGQQKILYAINHWNSISWISKSIEEGPGAWGGGAEEHNLEEDGVLKKTLLDL